MADAEASEAKPQGEEGASANPEHINLKVMGQDGNIVQFKIKKHTALKKLMATYCERAGLALQTIRFSFDGTRINESDTPKGLDMEVCTLPVKFLHSVCYLATSPRTETRSRCSSSSRAGRARV